MKGLHVATSGDATQEDKFSSKLFHRVNRILPEDQEVLTVPPDIEAKDAIKLMEERGFSQVPVVSRGEVLGVFSFRSFARGAARMVDEKVDPRGLPVDEFVERVPFVRLTEEFKPLIEFLDRHDAVLVGEEMRLQGIITGQDIIVYLHQIANAYLLLYEIELGLRELIRCAVDDDQLETCAVAVLNHQYKEDQIPTRLEEMVFGDYEAIIGYAKYWDYFRPVFGGTRDNTRAKLKSVRLIRNAIFHFKRELSIDEHWKLADSREWILRKLRIVESRRRGEIND